MLGLSPSSKAESITSRKSNFCLKLGTPRKSGKRLNGSEGDSKNIGKLNTPMMASLKRRKRFKKTRREHNNGHEITTNDLYWEKIQTSQNKVRHNKVAKKNHPVKIKEVKSQ